MGNKPKPGDRRDNVDKIQYNIDKTIQNYELAEEMIAKTDDENMKKVCGLFPVIIKKTILNNFEENGKYLKFLCFLSLEPFVE